ncbi:MAG: hypothetical protein QM786_17135 [Breznakibacter sp.]
MKKTIISLATTVCFLMACNQVSEKTKETINKGGEAVGKTATEFIDGVKEGIDKSLQCEIELAKPLIEKGIKTGKFTIEDNPNGGKNNVLTLYMIFDRDFKAPILAKAFDKSGLEIGRAKLTVVGKAGEAGYYDFVFDQRTRIPVKGKITLE